jgi:hypothetical protein
LSQTRFNQIRGKKSRCSSLTEPQRYRRPLGGR